MCSRFRDIQFSRSAIPLDYEKVLADRSFQNLLEYRLQQIEAVHIPMCQMASEDIESLLRAVKKNVEGTG